jgi:hypothetical protein
MEDVLRRVIQYRNQLLVSNPEFAVTSMAELAPGVIAVEDKAGECDVYFDAESWGYSFPEIWRGMDQNPRLRDLQLKVLPGKGRFPPVSKIEDAMAYAMLQLYPRLWHEAPQIRLVG